MPFTISIKASYIDIDAFYPYEGWDEDYEGWSDDEDEVSKRALIERCLVVSPDDESEIEELWGVLDDPSQEYMSFEGSAVDGCNASIEIDEHPFGDFRPSSRKSRTIDNPFSDSVPELNAIIPEIINSKFCFIKVWENSGGYVYEDKEGDFVPSKLTCQNGRFLYDGEEFDFTDGKGSSSYACFYKDGKEC